MAITLARFGAALTEARAKINHSLSSNPFGGLANAMANSVGLEWGWVLLFGSAITVIVLAMAAPRPRLDSSPVNSPKQDSAFSSADALIAEYVAQKKLPQTPQSPSTARPVFGRRRAP
jgi:hypothetical protein